ncbi:MAG TPA: C39 family peptidase [Anaerolineales bacterium]
MQNRFNRIWLVPIIILLGIGIFYLPPVYSRAMPRLEVWIFEPIRTRLNPPPEEAVFELVGASATDPSSGGTNTTQTPSPAPEVTPTPTQGPTLTPTITSTPLPDSVILKGIRYEDQKNRWNYCGPANLSMALNYIGWNGNRDVVAKAIKAGIQDPKLDFIQQGRSDVNVMPYEMVDFVNDETEFRALSRLGGNIDVAKKLLAADFPFIAEKGYYEKDYAGKVAWLGHYQFVTGYDDARGELIVQDTWNDGPNFRISYTDFMSNEAWLSFNNLFIVVYEPEREAELLAVLGPYVDPQWAARYQLNYAEEKIQTSSGIDQFFAWFAKGTSHVELFEYQDAAIAFDQVFSIYNSIGADDFQRPYRMMWYQTSPYKAYFYSGRYQDVIDLANVTLYETISKPTIEESLYWRGQAYYMIGDTKAAIDDYREALRLHPNWGPAILALQDLGVRP